VPAGAACATRPGIGPGTPYFEDASPLFRQAITKFDFEPADSDWSKIPSLDLMLAEARPRDTLTLWHLLSRVEGKDRERVYDRMVALVPAPAALERERVLRLDEYMLEFWKDALTNVWTDESFLRKKWIKVWTKGLGKIKGGEGKK